MVKPPALALLASWLIAASPTPAFAITPDELRTLVHQDEESARSRAGRVDSMNLGALVPNTVKTARDLAPGAKPARVVAPPESTSNPPPASPASDMFSAGGDRGAPIFSDAVPVDSAHPFGIRLGTWMHARLSGNTSSAAPGLAELVLTRSVTGDHRTLAAGTRFFARTRINTITRRMEMVAIKGITPGGREFRLTGLVFDTQKTSGLDGIVSADAGGRFRRGAGKGMLAAGNAALGTLFGAGTPASAAAGSATRSILDEAGHAFDRPGQPSLTIYVAAQPVLIRVEATF
ncbi:MAG: hypothetical protein ACYDDO_04720 [Acidiferrobacterales bacterium]